MNGSVWKRMKASDICGEILWTKKGVKITVLDFWGRKKSQSNYQEPRPHTDSSITGQRCIGRVKDPIGDRKLTGNIDKYSDAIIVANRFIMR